MAAPFISMNAAALCFNREVRQCRANIRSASFKLLCEHGQFLSIGGVRTTLHPRKHRFQQIVDRTLRQWSIVTGKGQEHRFRQSVALKTNDSVRRQRVLEFYNANQFN